MCASLHFKLKSERAQFVHRSRMHLEHLHLLSACAEQWLDWTERQQLSGPLRWLMSCAGVERARGFALHNTWLAEPTPEATRADRYGHRAEPGHWQGIWPWRETVGQCAQRAAGADRPSASVEAMEDIHAW